MFQNPAWNPPEIMDKPTKKLLIANLDGLQMKNLTQLW